MTHTTRDHILAIDQGTTGSTALVYRKDGKLIGRGYVELPQIFPRPGWVSHDPDAIIRATLRAVTVALASAMVSGERLAGIGITNQRETSMIWDRATSRPIDHAVVWQCRRTAPLCDRLKRQGHEPFIRRRTGLMVDAYFSGTKVRWLLDAHAGARRLAGRGRLAFGTVDTWLLWILTGGRVHATDATNASRTMLFDIHKKRWDDDLLKLLQVPKALLPEVHSSGHVFGETAKLGPFPAGIPIAGIAGDQQAALFGHGCVAPGSAKNTYGTGCFLMMHTGDRCVTSRRGLITTIACGPSGEPQYALEGSVFIAGAAVQWLRDGLRLIKDAKETEALARSVLNTGGVYLVPAFVGLGAPYWDQDARGALVGLTRGAGRAEIVRAALEAIAYQTVDVVRAMRQDSRTALATLRVDGGAAQNGFLMQFQSDVLGMSLVRPSSVEYTARGAALLAGRTVGLWRDARPLQHWDEAPTRFRPRMQHADAAGRYRGWQAAVARVRTGTAWTTGAAARVRTGAVARARAGDRAAR